MLSLGGVMALAAGTLCLTSGCSTLGYYAQSVNGHVALLNRARPVSQVLADPATPQTLRERLQLTERLRDYAVSELKLPDNPSYRRFADLQRPAAVWNVVAAPELSLTLKTWCFAVVGCVGYRGYFEPAPAEALAAELRAAGLEVSVNAIPAYSTLGKLPGSYFSDPLLSTFIQMPEGDLARMIFHELAHQVAYAAGDTVFNESFATSVERIGGQRWLDQHGSDQVRSDYERLESRRRTFREMTMKARNDLDAIFRSALSDAEKRAAKAARMAQLRNDYAALKAGPWLGFSGYDGWFARANNASLGVLAAYNQLVPQFERLFEREGGDFGRFYAEVKRLAALPRTERLAALEALQ
ncbi:MAG TPA: aminopeptidase [Rhizobacter sp.]|nr:aminopeptidase [Rhizobacter sp.]